MANLERPKSAPHGAAPGALAAVAASAQSASASRPFRIAVVGTGGRGTGHVRNLLKIEGVQIPALCDINEERLARAQGLVEKAGQPRPEGYSRGTTDYLRLCERGDLDLVINATPWEHHTPISVARPFRPGLGPARGALR